MTDWRIIKQLHEGNHLSSKELDRAKVIIEQLKVALDNRV